MKNLGIKVGTFPLLGKSDSTLFGNNGLLKDPSALMALLPKLHHLLVSPIDDKNNPINSLSGNETIEAIWDTQLDLIPHGGSIRRSVIQQRNRVLINNFCGFLALAMVFNTAVLPSKLPGIFNTEPKLMVEAEHYLLSPEGREECMKSDEYDEDVDVLGHFMLTQLQKKIDFKDKHSYGVILYLAMKADFYCNLKVITDIVLKDVQDNDDPRIDIRKTELYAPPKTVIGRIKTVRVKMGCGVYNSFLTMFIDAGNTNEMLVTEFLALWPFIMGNIRDNAKQSEIDKIKVMFKQNAGATLRLLHKWCQQDVTGHLFITGADEEVDDAYGCPLLKFK